MEPPQEQQQQQQQQQHRVFVGGLFHSITKEELSTRFQTFGDVNDVTIVQKNDGDGNITKTFGYVNLVTTQQKLNRCFALFGGTKWKGHELKVQLAKEDFISRLERERSEPLVVKTKKKKHNVKTYDDILERTAGMRKIVPGTPVEGEHNWVIGKYGRPLPIVYIPKISGRKTMKVDPSKFCHCVRKIADVEDGDRQVENLTWEYDGGEANVIKTKKKKKNEKMGNGENYVEELDITKIDKTVDTNDKKNSKKHKRKKREDVLNEVSAEGNSSTPIDHQLSKPKKRKGKHIEAETEDSQHSECVTEHTADQDTTVKQKKKKKKEKKEDEVISSPRTAVNVNTSGNMETLDILCSGDVPESTTINQYVPPKKHKKKKEKGDKIHASPSVAVNTDTINVSDEQLPCSKKKKKKKLRANEDVLIEENIVLSSPTTEEQQKETEVIIEKTDTSIPTQADNSLQNDIPEMVFYEDTTADEVDNTNEKVLGKSIIEQLSSSRREAPVSLPTTDAPTTSAANKTTSDIDCNESSDGPDEEVENLFDFELEDIGGKKNQNFLDTLVNGIEVREDVIEENENSCNESEEDSDDSSEDGDNMESTNNQDVPDLEIQVEIVPDWEKALNKEDVLSVDKKVKTSETLKPNKEEAPTDTVSSAKKLKKSKITNTNKQEKHALSEEQRTKSLVVRNSQISQNKDLVTKALKAVDDKTSSSGNRIVFDEESDKEEDTLLPVTKNQNENSDDKDKNEEALILSENDAEGSQAEKGIVSLFDDDDETDFTVIKIKPQFQGKEGEKLFKMQQSFKGDERFKLDERFAEDFKDEDEDSDNEHEQQIDPTEDQEEEAGGETADLLKEKEMNISVLEQVLGKPVKLDKKQSNKTMQRYDPENIEHKKYEVEPKPTDKMLNEGDEDNDSSSQKRKKVVQKLPEVSKDTFYAVTQSIKDLFGTSDTSTFSFFGSDDTPKDTQADVNEVNEVNDEVVEEAMECETITEDTLEDNYEEQNEVSNEQNDVPNTIKELAIDQSEQTTVDNEASICESRSKTNKFQTYLYFCENDPRFEAGESFMRTEELEELTNQWRSIRRNLTDDYKKKHKDARRRVRKIREKQFGQR